MINKISKLLIACAATAIAVTLIPVVAKAETICGKCGTGTRSETHCCTNPECDWYQEHTNTVPESSPGTTYCKRCWSWSGNWGSRVSFVCPGGDCTKNNVIGTVYVDENSSFDVEYFPSLDHWWTVGDQCMFCHMKKPGSKPVHSEPAAEVKEPENRPDPSAEAFGGRKPEELSVEEQKTSISYCFNSLRALGIILPENAVTTSEGGKSTDIIAVTADTRDTLNQQIYAQTMCASLGLPNVTPLKTYNMYSILTSYDTRNKSQVIKWADTGLKFGDTAFVVWYNQKLGTIQLLPAFVDVAGNVSVNVPALGDVSTMTVVKASK